MLRSLCMVGNGPFELDGRPQLAHCQSHCSHANVSSSQEHLSATVWVEQAMSKGSQPSMVESLLVDIRRNAHKNLEEFVSTEICRAL
jgi:hypothetical protein